MPWYHGSKNISGIHYQVCIFLFERTDILRNSYLYAEKAYIAVDGIKYHAFVHKEIPLEVAADVTPFTVRYILFGIKQQIMNIKYNIISDVCKRVYLNVINIFHTGTPNLRTPRGMGGTPRVTPQMVNRTPGGGVFQVPNATPGGLPGQPYSSFQVGTQKVPSF